MEVETQPKWEGKSMVELASVKAEQPGLIRYCTTTEPLFPAVDDHEKTINWGKEKLLMIDPIQRCKIEWSFVADPIDGKTLKDLASVLDHYCLQFMAKKIEHAILQSGSV
ncbi:hypothetical protein QYF36_012467 [Acer negundo]|nr:hypothetical protein QYF36_012467 [Acer negundo]